MAAGAPRRIGVVTHFFPRVNAAGIQLESGTLRVGDRIHIQGHTTDFYQTVRRMEVEHRPTEFAGPGAQVGLQVDERVREHDVVYKITS